jgi:hypothetical protein
MPSMRWYAFALSVMAVSAASSKNLFPILISNVCALGANNAVGMDGSVLIQRSLNFEGTMLQFYSANPRTPADCNITSAFVREFLVSSSAIDQFHWIGVPVTHAPFIKVACLFPLKPAHVSRCIAICIMRHVGACLALAY